MSPLGSNTITTSPRRMSCAMSSSASRVLPTRVVPRTRVWPTRSAIFIQTSDSAGSTPWMAGSPPSRNSSAGECPVFPAILYPAIREPIPGRSRSCFSGIRASRSRWVCRWSQRIPREGSTAARGPMAIAVRNPSSVETSIDVSSMASSARKSSSSSISASESG
jgi:hypothetical protein